MADKDQRQATSSRDNEANDELAERRSHFEGIHNGEAWSYRVPDFFSLSALFSWLDEWWRKKENADPSSVCSKCHRHMGYDITCPHCGDTSWGTIGAVAILGCTCLLAPLLMLTVDHAVAKWGCTGCSIVLGLGFLALAISGIASALRTRKNIRRREQNYSGDAPPCP